MHSFATTRSSARPISQESLHTCESYSTCLHGGLHTRRPTGINALILGYYTDVLGVLECHSFVVVPVQRRKQWASHHLSCLHAADCCRIMPAASALQCVYIQAKSRCSMRMHSTQLGHSHGLGKNNELWLMSHLHRRVEDPRASMPYIQKDSVSDERRGHYATIRILNPIRATDENRKPQKKH